MHGHQNIEYKILPVTSHKYYLEVKIPLSFENFYENSCEN